MAKLKPCPFGCESDYYLEIDYDKSCPDRRWIVCHGCGCRGPVVEIKPEKAWNTRQSLGDE